MATEKNAKKTTEVATTGGYGEIANMNFLSDAMDDDCAGLDFQLERIKLPSGGMTAFEVPAGDGENTDLAKDYAAGRFQCLSLEEYARILRQCLLQVPESVVFIHLLA